MEAWAAFFTGVLGPILLLLTKHSLDKRKKKKDPLTEAAEFSASFENQIENMLYEFEIDRVWITQFHNGGHFYPTGKSIQKFSMFYEIINPQKLIKSIKMSLQNIPVSLFSNVINHIFSKGILNLYDIKNNNNSYGLQHINSQCDIHSSYLFALKNLDGKFIGILGIDYQKLDRPLSQDDLNKLQTKTTQLGVYLNNHLTL
jgi:hypothetical protein